MITMTIMLNDLFNRYNDRDKPKKTNFQQSQFPAHLCRYHLRTSLPPLLTTEVLGGYEAESIIDGNLPETRRRRTEERIVSLLVGY